MGKVIKLQPRQEMMTPRGEAAMERLAGNLESTISDALDDGITYWMLAGMLQIALNGVHREMDDENDGY